MEGKPVCRIKDGYVKAVLRMMGFAEGDGNVILADKKSDAMENMHDSSVIIIPMYDAKDYIKWRLPGYGGKIYEE